MIKVLIADDQELIRQSLSIILGLKEEISVVGGVGDGTEVLEFIAKEKPDIILMDIRMPTMDGVECTKIVKEICVQCIKVWCKWLSVKRYFCG